MRKLFCWCAALTATGAIFIAFAAAFVSAHPNSHPGRLAMRAWCGKEQTPIVEQVARIDPEPDLNDSAVFLGEPAVAQEFHKRLPLGVFAADQTEQNEAEEKEEARLFTKAHHNRLPGTILFSEETQEPSTGSSSQPAGTDKPMPPATSDHEAGELLPATTEGSGPQFMSYCVDEEDAKAEMPYAEEEPSNAFRQLASETMQVWSIPLLSDCSFPLMDLSLTKSNRDGQASQMIEVGGMSEVHNPGSSAIAKRPDAEFMSYSVDEGDAKAKMPYAEEEETSSRVGQAIYLRNTFICGGPLITAEEWRDFIKGPNVFPLGENEEEDGSKDSKSTRVWPYDWDDTVEATPDSGGPDWLDVIHDHSLLINLALNLMSFPSSSMMIEPTTDGFTIFLTNMSWPRIDVRGGEKLRQDGKEDREVSDQKPAMGRSLEKPRDDKPSHITPERVHGGIQ